MSAKVPGFEEYTPSRLEWLVVMLNSLIPFLSVSDHGIDYVFLPGSDGKSLKLRVSHFKEIDPETVSSFTNNVKEYALDVAKLYKWDSWLEIQEEITITEENLRPPQDQQST